MDTLDGPRSSGKFTAALPTPMVYAGDKAYQQQTDPSEAEEMFKSTQRGVNMSVNEHLGTFDEEQPRVMQNRYTPDVATCT